MKYSLQSKITDHSIDLNNLAERVIVGPQEEVLRGIESFNHRFRTDIKCTKTFRWEPGFYKKLKALQLKTMGFDKSSRTVRTSFSKVANNDWYYRQLKQSVTRIDGMLYTLRSNNMTFQDNTESVTESTYEWFNNIMSTTEVINNGDNPYTFNVYHAKGSDELQKDYILFIIEVDEFNMDIGNNDNYAPIKTGKVKMFIALDLVRVIGAVISDRVTNFGNEYMHHGHRLGGQYLPTAKGLYFPYVSSGRGYHSRVIDYSLVNDYSKMHTTDQEHEEESGLDGYTSLCLGDLKDKILIPMAKGRLDEVMFWLNKWGGFYNINTTGPLNNYTKMYHGAPAVLYNDGMDGILSPRSSRNCEYTVPIVQSESYCDIYECTMRDVCSRYENAYTIVDDEVKAMREQILANYMISKRYEFEVLADSNERHELLDRALNQMDRNWGTAEAHIDDMMNDIQSYFSINVSRNSMMYIMASLAREVNYSETREYMDDYDNGEIGFYDWLDQHYGNRTIDPEIIPMEVASSEPVRDTSELERMLLESYSASGRGIPISLPRVENNAEVPF